MMANGQTTIQFGDLMLVRCHTRNFRQEQVFDESGTDLMYQRFTVSVRGYIHGMYGWLQLNLPDLARGGSAAYNLIGMRVNLPPRQRFAYRIGADSTGMNGGYLALYAEPYPARTNGVTHLDVNNGPKCKDLRITHIAADNVIGIEAEFEICKLECAYSPTAQASGVNGYETAGTAPGNTKGVLSNRWSCVDNIDTQLRTVRTYQGRLRVASNNINPNAFRSYVVPPLVPGMRRDQIQFGVSSDGLVLDYTIQDVEVAQSAPYPAKRWSVVHSEGVGEGMLCTGNTNIMLAGARDVDKSQLITIGMNIVQAQLIGNAGNNANNVQNFLESLVVTDHIGDEQVVNITASVKRRKNGGGLLDWRIAMTSIGKPLDETMLGVDGYDAGESFGGRTIEGNPEPPYYQGPVSLIGMYLPYLQTPCNDNHKIVPENSSLGADTNPNAVSSPRTSITALVVPTTPDDDDALSSDSHKTAIYTHWRMESTFRESEMKLALPIANSGYYADGEATSVVTLAKPQCIRVVRVDAERVGLWPEFPSGSQLAAIMGDGGNVGSPSLTQTFLGKRRRFATPFYTAAGQKAFRVSAEYFFALNRRPKEDEALPVGRTMWTTDGNISTTDQVNEGWT